MANVQIFGTKKSAATRAAERFFKERRAEIHFVDLDRKPMAPAEIKRFIDHRGGLQALIDRDGKAFAASGLAYLRVTDADLLDRIARDPGLLRLPLVRSGTRVSVGQDEDAWKAMLESR